MPWPEAVQETIAQRIEFRERMVCARIAFALPSLVQKDVNLTTELLRESRQD